MATKTVTLTPTAQPDIYRRGIFAYYFNYPAAKLSSISFTLKVSAQEDLSFFEASVYLANGNTTQTSAATKIGDIRYSAYDSGTGTKNIPLSYNQSFSYTNGFSVILDANVDYASGSFASFSASATRDDLKISSISPASVEINKETVVSFTGKGNHKLSIAFSANNKDLKKDTVESSSSTYTIKADPGWFKTAGTTKSSLSVSVSVTDESWSDWPLSASKTFTVTQPELTMTKTAPTYSGATAKIVLAFTGRKGHTLQYTVSGPNSPNLASGYIYDDTYSEIIAEDSWFTSENGNSFTVTISVTDTVWNREVKDSFTLYASDTVKPKVSAITLSNIPGDVLLKDYSYVAEYSKVSFGVTVQAGQATIQEVKVRFGSEEVTLTKQTSTYYTGQTSTAITGATNFTATVTDARQRTGQKQETLTRSQITFLQPIKASFSPSSAQTAGSVFTISPTNYFGKFSYTIKTGNYSLESGNDKESSINVNTSHKRYFTDTEQDDAASINLTINIVDGLNRSANFEYKINAPLPEIKNVTLTNIADPRMPKQSPYNTFVFGYSQAQLKFDVTYYAAKSNIKVTYNGNEYTVTNVVRLGDSKTYECTYITPEPITGLLSFTIKATDIGNRNATHSERIQSGYNPGTMSISPNATTMEAGKTTNLTLNNAIGTYSYTFTALNSELETVELVRKAVTTEATKIEEVLNAEWFGEIGTENDSFDITVTVTDQIDREAKSTITLKLPVLRIELYRGNIKIDKGNWVTDETVQIRLINRAGRTVPTAFTEHETGAELWSQNIAADTYDLLLSKADFASLCVDIGEKKSSFQIDVESTAGKETANTDFTFALPTLSATVTTSTPRAVTVGDDFSFTFANTASEPLSVDFYYGTKKLGTTFGPYSTSPVLITAQQFFDEANVQTSQRLEVIARVHDQYSRSVNIPNLTIIASDSMKPTVGQPTFVVTQPDTVSERLQSLWISGITRLSVTLPFTLHTNAALSSATIKYAHMLTPTNMTIDRQNNTCTFTMPDTVLAGDNVYDFVVTDERGMKTTIQYTAVPGVYEYHRPIITLTGGTNGYHRCDIDKTASDIGEYCNMFATYDISQLTDKDGNVVKNDGLITVSTSPASTPYMPQIDAITSAPYIRQIEYFFAADIERTYIITAIAADEVTVVTTNARLSTAGVIMDFRNGGKGIGFGKVAEHDKSVEVNPEWTLRSEKIEVTINNVPRDLSTLLATIMDKLDIS